MFPLRASSKPHAHASCTSAKIFADVEDGQTPRARAALTPWKIFQGPGGKPHERESYSLQNTVAVTIMFVMHSSKEAL